MSDVVEELAKEVESVAGTPIELETMKGKPRTKVGVTRKDKTKGKKERNKSAGKARKVTRKIANKKSRKTGSKKRV